MARSAPHGRPLRARAARRRLRAAPRAERGAAATGRCSRSGRSSQSATPAATPKRPSSELEVEVAASERRNPHQRHERPDRPRAPQGELRGREEHVDRRCDERDRQGAPEGDGYRSQPRAGTAGGTGLAIVVRSTKSPTAASSERNVDPARDQELRSRGRLGEGGHGNCGAGPGFGPTANVKAPRTGWPSTEITRQTTRYQPSRRRFNGTSSSSGFVGERRGDPVVCWAAAASVTETIAKRGSTASRVHERDLRRGLFDASRSPPAPSGAGPHAPMRRRAARARPPAHERRCEDRAPHAHVQGERRGERRAVDAALEEQTPGSGDRHEHADRQLARRRRRARDLRAAERRSCSRSRPARRRACGSSRAMPRRKKIACASAPNHGVKRAGLPSGRVDREGEEAGMDRTQVRHAVQREAVAVDGLRRSERREGRAAGTARRRAIVVEELEVRLRRRVAGTRRSTTR